MEKKRMSALSEREKEYRSLRRFVRRCEKPANAAARLVAAALERELTPRQRQMVNMYYLEQHSMREIADMLEVNPSTVTRTLQIARAKLQAAMDYCGAQMRE